MITTEKVKKIEKLFSEYDNKQSPGCVLGIIQHGEYVYSRGFGVANLCYDIPITKDTIFRIASTSKQFTAFAIALLEEMGSVHYEDDIRKYFPDFPQYNQPIKVKHLIHHTSGIRDIYAVTSITGAEMADYEPLEFEIFYDLITRQKNLDFTPGTEFSYSNSGYLLLSMLVEKTSGMNLTDFAAKHIFKPLDMKHTLFNNDRTLIIPQRAQGYMLRADGNYGISESSTQVTGDGAVFTNLNDLLKWDQNFYHPKIGTPATIRKIVTPGRFSDGSTVRSEDAGYGYGLFVSEYGGLKEVKHGGAWAGFRAEMIRYPDEETSIICLSNYSEFNPTVKCREVARIMLSERMDTLDKNKTAIDDEDKFGKITQNLLDSKNYSYEVTELKEYEGEYILEEVDYVYNIQIIDSHLSVELKHKPVPLISREKKDHFMISKIEAPLRFTRNQNGKINGLVIDTSRGKGFIGIRK